ncbi:MAG: SIMPL domain-containing protein [Hyphomicrobium sp.]|nr:SIMPL domain-containing protein [Hyphomicrobium sp.]
MRIRTFILPPLAAVLVLAVAPPAAHADKYEIQRSITVTARGAVAAEPDMARITSGMTSEADTAAQALSRNSQSMKEVIGGLKAAGIDPKDIQTSSFRIEPRYARAKEGQASVIDGYRVTNQIQITARDLGRLGDVLDNLVSFGANQMAGLTFEVSEAETLRDKARMEAVANALRHAKLYAAATGAKVGDVRNISEGPVSIWASPTSIAMRKEAVPTERGTEVLQASVTITWTLVSTAQ